MMLAELELLFDYCERDAAREEYIRAIEDDNCLGKRTVSTRRLSRQRLSELYALDPEIPLFIAFRRCWYADDGSSYPVLALLMSLARDPLLRETAEPILTMTPGEELSRIQLRGRIERSASERLNDSTIDKVVRNTASTWTQSGHLTGRTYKVREGVPAKVMGTVFALLLGYLLGSRGDRLFSTFWTKVLDASTDELIDKAAEARRLGFLKFIRGGGVTELGFDELLSPPEGRDQPSVR